MQFDTLVSGVLVFFFQAEDGIRDLVRSRGLGDVYKRQVDENTVFAIASNSKAFTVASLAILVDEKKLSWDAVSYTHLTLPTSDLV